MQQRAARESSKPSEEIDGLGPSITDLPDPDGVYSSVVGKADFSKTYLEAPNIRDGNGVLITPAEYQSKLVNGAIVMVRAYMKLYVHFRLGSAAMIDNSGQMVLEAK